MSNPVFRACGVNKEEMSAKGGSKSYNEKLSHRRAISTMNYLIDKGIEPSRLTAKGYGESQLKVECGTCNSCSKEQHQSNRRSEFIIVSMEY